MERVNYSPLNGYLLCELYDDGTYIFYLYTASNGVGYIKKATKATPYTEKYSTFTINISTTLWNFSTHQPRISASEYYYWHNHPQNKTRTE